jgi:hypothetical protein
MGQNRKFMKKLKIHFLECPRFYIWYLFSYIMHGTWTFENNQKVYGICLLSGDFGTFPVIPIFGFYERII